MMSGTIYTWFNRYRDMGIVGLFFLSDKKNKSVLSIENAEHISVSHEVVKKTQKILKSPLLK